MTCRSFARVAGAAWLACVFVGCSRGPAAVKAKGTLMDGPQPAKADKNFSIQLLLVPEVAAGVQFTTYPTILQDDGGFEFQGPDHSGVPVGKYRVRLSSMAPTPSPRLRQYLKAFDKSDSPLTLEVKEGGGPLTLDVAPFLK